MKHRLVRSVALLVVLSLAAGVAAYALALSLYVDCGLQYMGSWTLNYPTSSVAFVRVQNRYYGSAPVVVQVKARAVDGSTVNGSASFLLNSNEGRQVAVPLPKRVVALEFIQIRWQGAYPYFVCATKPSTP